jgi:general secretion pathway protein J
MIKRFNKNSGPSAGFTLVELLLAITLMSILLGLTYSGLRAATRSSERGEKLLAAGGELRAAHQFLRRQMNQMLPLPFAVTNGGQEQELRIVFEGDARHIQYVASMPGYLGTGGPQVQLVELVHDDDGKVEIHFYHDLLQGFEQGYLFERDPVILLEGVDSGGFEFLGKDEDGELTGWTMNWDQPGILPVAVRLNLEFSDDVNIRWPELVAGVKLDPQAVMGAAGRRGGETYQRKMQELIKNKGVKKS